MPWHVARSAECPESKPWAVIKDDDGEVEGCHADKAAANRQMAALYAQESINPTGKQMQRKSFDIIETKADDTAGTFEALVSVFGNVDSVGDRMQPGAFTKTLDRWNASGDPIPVILSHQWDDPMAHIGVVHPGDAKEVDRGLLVKGHLDVKDNQVAAQVHRLMKRRSLKEFSFGYRVLNEKRAKDGANDLTEVDLVEVGPTLKGANPETELHAVKSALEAETKPDPPSEAELQRQDQERRLAEETKDVPKDTDPAPDPIAKVVGEFETLKSEIGGDLEGIKKALEEKQERDRIASEAELRKQDQERRLKEAEVPKDTDPAPDPVEKLQAKVDELLGQFEEFKTEVGKNLEGIKAAVEEPRGANIAKHDPLKSRSLQAVLEVESDGMSKRKPPRQEPQEPQPEPSSEGDLKRDFERQMLELLTE